MDYIMKDFTKWMDAWNTYNSAYDKAAKAGYGNSWTFFFMFLMVAASFVALFYEPKREKPIVMTVQWSSPSSEGWASYKRWTSVVPRKSKPR